MHRMLIAALMMNASLGIAQTSPGGNLGSQLRQTVVESRKQLGQMPPWQARIFDEEVVPQYQRFIKDYKTAAAGGVKAEVDFGNLRNFLRFQGQGAVAVYLGVDEKCTPCRSSQPTVQSLIKDRLERRGLQPIWIATEDLGEPKPRGKALHDKLYDIAQMRNANAALVVTLLNAPKDSIDSAHADEQSFVVTSYLNVRGLAKAEGRSELLGASEMEATAGQLLTDAFTEMGARMERIAATSSDPTKEEMTVAIGGIRDFAHYQELRQKLEERLKAVATLEERRISRGRVVLAVVTEKSALEIRGQLRGFEAEVEVK